MVLKLVLVLCYIALATCTVFEYRDKVLTKIAWYESLQDCVTSGVGTSKIRQVRAIALLLGIWGLTLLVLFAIAPILRLVLRSMRLREEAAAEKAWNEARIERERIEKDRRETDERRALARKEWLKENRIKLYYHTICGITAVMREGDYLAATVHREREEANGTTNRAAQVLLSRFTFTFVNEQGAALIDSKTRFDSIRNRKVAGWIADLHTLVKKHKVELIQNKDIFVPWISGAVIPMQLQLDIIENWHPGKSLYEELIGKQAPAKYQPLK